jgi:hypothetical protein
MMALHASFIPVPLTVVLDAMQTKWMYTYSSEGPTAFVMAVDVRQQVSKVTVHSYHHTLCHFPEPYNYTCSKLRSVVKRIVTIQSMNMQTNSFNIAGFSL